MKVLGICASPRGSKSTTLRLVQAVLDGAKASGAEVELVDLCKLDIKFCNACQVCFKEGKCVHKDDFQGLYDKILAADGLVWGAPNYFRSVTAQMKTLIDRMADAVHCQLLNGKYCCSVASGGSNYDQVTTYLDGIMLNFGAFVTRKRGCGHEPGACGSRGCGEEGLPAGQISGRRYPGQTRLYRAEGDARGDSRVLQEAREDEQKELGARVRVLE